jgi:DNA-binding CsgD family transcriptional regulator/tetratricopeptide (TPR) repeat protein
VVATLLERDGDLALLDDALAGARQGQGRVVLVTGEAGIGKSSLVDAWLATVDDAASHVGWCDDLLSGRALGPLRDIARRAGGPLSEAIADGDLGRVLDAVLALLNDPLRPTVLVVEDLHWADEATLDVVRYVGRRIRQLPAVLVGTYRDDDVDGQHPLTGVLAVLTTAPVTRVEPRPLTESAIRQMAARNDVDPSEVLATTGGNPFFVAETLQAASGEIARTVVDSVLARLQALPEQARRAVEELAIVPGRIEADLVDAIEDDPTVIADAERRGLLVPAPGGGLRFRHELTRRAVEASLSATDRRAAHRRVLDHLLTREADDPSRLLHHAVGAEDPDRVVTYGMRAADEAFRAGAFRPAAAAQDHVLRHAGLLSPEEHARLLEQDAWTQLYLHRFPEAVRRAEEAVTARRNLRDTAGTALALCALSRVRYAAIDSEGALAAAEEADAVAAGVPDPEVRAEAGVARLSLWALLDHADLACAALPQLLEDVRALGRSDLESLVLNYGAVSRVLHEHATDEAVAMFVRAIAVARDHGHLDAAARGFTNLVGVLLLWRRHDEALQWLDEGLEFTADHDLAYLRFTMLAHRGTRLADVGRWDEAEADLSEMMARIADPGVLGITAARGLARIAVRRGDDDAHARLTRARDLATRSAASQYLGPVAALHAEQAFLTESRDAVVTAVAEALALEGAGAWAHGEALAWCRRADAPLPDGWERIEMHEEWAHVLHGRWQEAAAMARAEGRVYDEAMALLDSGDREQQLAALAVFDRLGARPAARLTRQRLAESGMRSIPRGPRPSTLSDPAGLTRRQAEVMELLVQGLTNSQIADQLVLSVRTVDHHVSAILQRLGVTDRREAAAAHAALLGARAADTRP